jgi:hypothetical protein
VYIFSFRKFTPLRGAFLKKRYNAGVRLGLEIPMLKLVASLLLLSCVSMTASYADEVKHEEHEIVKHEEMHHGNEMKHEHMVKEDMHHEHEAIKHEEMKHEGKEIKHEIKHEREVK